MGCGLGSLFGLGGLMGGPGVLAKQTEVTFFV